jgi:murein DD-endopeptidase MepM/ murein hydrolase activator NlpD
VIGGELMTQRVQSAMSPAPRRKGVRLVWAGAKQDRHVEFSKTGFIAAGLVLVLLCGWYLVATAYLIFRDEMLAGMMRSQAEMQYAYEDRIASLRAHLDRVASRQLVDQDSFEGRLNELLVRQAKLETRSAVLSTLASRASKSGIALEAPVADDSGETASAPVRSLKPVPEGSSIGKQGAIVPLMGGLTIAALRREEETSATGSVKDRIGTVNDSLTMIDKEQRTALSRMERQVTKGPAQFRAVLAEIGLSESRFKPASKSSDKDHLGGPLIPLKGEVTDFSDRVSRIQAALKSHQAFGQAMNSLPLRRPVAKNMAITSGFGPRSDPFLAKAAMHSGIDFRGDTGDSARATAPGRITEVGYNGGYGKMIEIDHGYGLTTRYAHLSAFDVAVGDIVERGQVIGRIGSTGRSTGPHLHYEIRIDGEAIDPMRFLRAAKRLP